MAPILNFFWTGYTTYVPKGIQHLGGLRANHVNPRRKKVTARRMLLPAAYCVRNRPRS